MSRSKSKGSSKKKGSSRKKGASRRKKGAGRKKVSRAQSCGCAAVYHALVKVEQVHSGRVKKLIAQARKAIGKKSASRSRRAGRFVGSRSADWETSGGMPSERDTHDEF